MTVNLDWENLGFSYMKLPYRFLAYYRNGQWEEGKLTEDATLHISSLHQAFTMVSRLLKDLRLIEPRMAVSSSSVQMRMLSACNALAIVS